MKRNILIKTESGSFKAIPYEALTDASSVSANLGNTDGSSWITDPEETIIKGIDERKMSPQQIQASHFLEFLGNQRLTLEELKQLPIEEQTRLKKEFLGE